MLALKAATVARLENLPSQSRRRYRIDRPVRRPHDFVSAAVRTSEEGQVESFALGIASADAQAKDHTLTPFDSYKCNAISTN